jgi:hypothetical protein
MVLPFLVAGGGGNTDADAGTAGRPLRGTAPLSLFVAGLSKFLAAMATTGPGALLFFSAGARAGCACFTAGLVAGVWALDFGVAGGGVVLALWLDGLDFALRFADLADFGGSGALARTAVVAALADFAGVAGAGLAVAGLALTGLTLGDVRLAEGALKGAATAPRALAVRAVTVALALALALAPALGADFAAFGP